LELLIPKSGLRSSPNGPQILRGNQAADFPLHVAIVGGGKACLNLLQILKQNRLSRLNMKLLGICDVNPAAPGFRYAKRLGLFTTQDYRELLRLEGLNLVIELTGTPGLVDQIAQAKPPKVSVMDFRAARLLWDLIQMLVESELLQEAVKFIEDKERRHKQLILDSLPYRIMVVNVSDMTIDTVNRTFLEQFNLTYENVLGKHCYEVRYGLDRPCGEIFKTCYLEDFFEEIRKKKIYSTIREYLGPDGEERFDVVTLSPVMDERGEMTQILEASRDVTDRITLEREVQKAKTFFEKVIQSTVDGIVVVDTKGNVLIFNEGMERLTGYTADEIINRGHLSTFYNIDVAKENMRKMRSDQYGPPGKLNPTSMTIDTRGGEEIPVTLSASMITIDNKDIGSVGVFTDMREVLKMRKDLEEAHLQLVQSEKIASVGRMAAGVAHEINNPLSGILIYAELLKEGLDGDEEKRKDAQEIIDQTLRCKKIVSDLLEFSRQSVGKVSAFTIGSLIDKSLNVLIHQASFQDIDVLKQIQADMPEMIGDLGQLQQVMTNLFTNAADAMSSKGRLAINAGYDPDRGVFTIEVADSGPGIPEHLRDKIFDIFFTTKPVGKGTGLGLSISQNIVKLHGGSLTFHCPPEGGTTFVIQMPLGFVAQAAEEPLFLGMAE
jgi:two-component system NtrC family sensor kinase